MKPFLLLIALFFSSGLSAQQFKPDISGYVNSDAFREFCNRKQYSLVGTFDSLPGPKKGMAAQVIKNGKWIYIDLNGKEFSSYELLGKEYGFDPYPERQYYERWQNYDRDDNLASEPELLPVPGPVKYTGSYFENGKVGFKYEDKVLIKPEYEEVYRLSNYDGFLFLRVRKNNLYGLCDYQGKLITPVVYSDIRVMAPNSPACFFIITKDKKQGVLSRAGKETIAAEYDEISQEGVNIHQLLSVKKNGMKGLFSLNGKMIAAPEYESLQITGGKQQKYGIIVKKSGLSGYINQTGELKVPCAYEKLFYDENNFLLYQTASGYGALDTNGVKVTEPVYVGIDKPENGKCYIVKAMVDGKERFGILDENGNTIEAPQFAFVQPFRNATQNSDIYLFCKDKRYEQTGLFNVKTLKWVQACNYKVNSISGKYIVLSEPNPEKPGEYLTGVADQSGNFVIPVKYSDLELDERAGLATAMLNGKYGALDLKGEVMLPFNYERIESVSYPRNVIGEVAKMQTGYFRFQYNGAAGIVHKSGTVTIPAVYDAIDITPAGLICRKANSTKIISLKGKLLGTTSHIVQYRTEGFFQWKDSTGVKAIDLYGHAGTLPEKPEPPRYNWLDPVPVPEPTVVYEDKIFTQGEIEEQAEFQGGTIELRNYMSKNLYYPESAFENGIEGKVYVSFIVEKDGRLTNIKVKKGIPECRECDMEAKKMVEKMPAWVPARSNGKVVRSEYNLPVYFRLD